MFYIYGADGVLSPLSLHATVQSYLIISDSVCVQDLQQRAEAKVAGLEAHIAMLKDQIASLQVWPPLE